MPTLAQLRRHAVARSLFPPTTLPRAIEKLGFVQADPIRAPARAQDLTLRHRARGYRAGDLERLYPELEIEEGFFVNYGFLLRADYLRMQPRMVPRAFDAATRRRASALLEFVRERGSAHPRDVHDHFQHGKTTNYWGGSSNATTHLLDLMHYRGLLRVVRRENGIRIYAPQDPAPATEDPDLRRAQLDALVDLIVRKYAPLPAASFATLVRRLRYAAPQWSKELSATLLRAKKRLAHATVDGIEWYWPEAERPDQGGDEPAERVRLLSPFDPIVWDRRRFELFWGWAYRFEAYTPAAKRKLGYYALPLLWRDRVVGWGNSKRRAGRVELEFGFVEKPPRSVAFRRELEAEVTRLRGFLVQNP